MTPRSRLSRRLRRTVLGMAVIYTSATAAACLGPIICDPLPPPSSTPGATPDPSVTPMICDPPPPPTMATRPRPTGTPMICDPAPFPRVTPHPQETATRQFRVRSSRVSTDPSLDGAGVRGTVLDARERPLTGLRVVATGRNAQVEARTDSGGAFSLRLPEPGSYLLVVEDDRSSGVALELRRHDLATVEWMEAPQQQAAASLPLAEIRSVEIAWQEGLTFAARSPWPGARYRWSTSGGGLSEAGESATWQPPAEPGRYLLQVVADWGAAGLAVDSAVLTVEEDGDITIA